MTGIERVTAALNRERTDRPPFDFWAEETTLNRLYEHLGHNDLERFLDESYIDIRAFKSAEPQARPLAGCVFENMWGERFVYRASEWGLIREDTDGALHGAQSLDEIMSFPWPDNDALDYGALREVSEEIAGALVVRARRPGDYFTPEGMKTGKKKIQDYFVDRKIPKGKRGHYLLVCHGSEAIWVIDPFSGNRGEISERYKVTGRAKEVLLLEIISNI